MVKVEIEKMELIENTFSREGKVWTALTLIEASKNLEVFDLPLAGINLNVEMWSATEKIHGFLFHAKRIMDTNLTYPIILDDRGTIADGWHRVCKAILMGKETIKAVRLQVMPNADAIYETKNKTK